MKFEKEILEHQKESIKYIYSLLNGTFSFLRQKLDANDVFNEGIINIQQYDEFSYLTLKRSFISFLKESYESYGKQVSYNDQGVYVEDFDSSNSDYQCKVCLEIKHISRFPLNSGKCFTCNAEYQKDRRISLHNSYLKYCIKAVQKERIKRGMSNDDKRSMFSMDTNYDQLLLFKKRITEKRRRKNLSPKEKSIYWNKATREKITDGYVRKLFHEVTLKKIGSKITPNAEQIELVRTFIKNKRDNPHLFRRVSFLTLFPEFGVL